MGHLVEAKPGLVSPEPEGDSSITPLFILEGLEERIAVCGVDLVGRLVVRGVKTRKEIAGLTSDPDRYQLEIEMDRIPQILAPEEIQSFDQIRTRVMDGDTIDLLFPSQKILDGARLALAEDKVQAEPFQHVSFRAILAGLANLQAVNVFVAGNESEQVWFSFVLPDEGTTEPLLLVFGDTMIGTHIEPIKPIDMSPSFAREFCQRLISEIAVVFRKSAGPEVSEVEPVDEDTEGWLVQLKTAMASFLYRQKTKTRKGPPQLLAKGDFGAASIEEIRKRFSSLYKLLFADGKKEEGSQRSFELFRQVYKDGSLIIGVQGEILVVNAASADLYEGLTYRGDHILKLGAEGLQPLMVFDDELRGAKVRWAKQSEEGKVIVLTEKPNRQQVLLEVMGKNTFRKVLSVPGLENDERIIDVCYLKEPSGYPGEIYFILSRTLIFPRLRAYAREELSTGIKLTKIGEVYYPQNIEFAPSDKGRIFYFSTGEIIISTQDTTHFVDIRFGRKRFMFDGRKELNSIWRLGGITDIVSLRTEDYLALTDGNTLFHLNPETWKTQENSTIVCPNGKRLFLTTNNQGTEALLVETPINTRDIRGISCYFLNIAAFLQRKEKFSLEGIVGNPDLLLAFSDFGNMPSDLIEQIQQRELTSVVGVIPAEDGVNYLIIFDSGAILETRMFS